MKRLFAFAVNETDVLRRLPARCEPLCFALKWFWPGARDTSFPLRVLRMRLVYDLFVFMFGLLFFFAFLLGREIAFYHTGKSLRAFSDRL